MSLAQEAETGRFRSQYPPDLMDRRYCPMCDEYLPLARFYADKRASSGLTRRCKDHHIAEAYKARKKNQPKSSRWAAQRNGFLLRKYGITLDDYQEMLAQQEGKCAICGSTEAKNFGDTLVVDHDHATGKVRGLLCGTCNTALGKFRDDPQILRSAICYLAVNK